MPRSKPGLAAIVMRDPVDVRPILVPRLFVPLYQRIAANSFGCSLSGTPTPGVIIPAAVSRLSRGSLAVVLRRTPGGVTADGRLFEPPLLAS